MTNSYTPFRAESFSERRERRKKEFAELLAAARNRRTRRTARQISEGQTEQQTVQPTVNPFVPSAQQEQFEASQVTQRPTALPFGVDTPTVYAPEAQREVRGQPEFGTFFGSGLLENVAGGALRTLENLQKGTETVGGTVVGTIGALTPGDFMGYEKNLDNVIKERGDRYGFWDAAGQFQALAEAFRRTDMPSVRMDVIPGKGLNLPGGASLNEIDIGVKGAIELLPEAILTIATGGVSATGSLARRAAVGTARTLGADIPIGAAKGIGSVGRRVAGIPGQRARVKGSPEAMKRLERMRERTRSKRMREYTKIGDPAKTDSYLDKVNAPEDSRVRQIINARSPLAKGILTKAVNLWNPTILAASAVKDKLGRLLLYHGHGYAAVDGATEAEMGKFLNRLNQANKHAVDAGEEEFFSTVGRNVGGKVQLTGLPEIPFNVVNKAEVIADSNLHVGTITGTSFEGINGKVWTNVFENFFVNKGKVERGAVRNSKESPFLKGTTGRKLGKEQLDENGFFIRYAGGDRELDRMGTYIRHYQDQLEMAAENGRSMGLDFGKKFEGQFVNSIYAPRRPAGGPLFEQVDKLNDNVQTAIKSPSSVGVQPRAQRKRQLDTDTLQELVEEDFYEMLDPMATLREHQRDLYRAGIDKQLSNRMKVLSKDKNYESVVNVASAMASLGGAVRAVRAGKKLQETRILKSGKSKGALRIGTADKLEDYGFGSITEDLRELSTSKLTKAQRDKKLKKLETTLKHEIKIFDKRYLKPGEGNKETWGHIVKTYKGLGFSDQSDINRILKAHNLHEKGFIEHQAEWLGQAGDWIRSLRTGFDFGFWLIQGIPSLGLPAARFAAGDLKQGQQMSAAWGKSVRNGFDAFFRPDRVVKTLMENADISSEAVANGLQLSRSSTDVFNVLSSTTRLGGPIGTGTDKYKKILRRFEGAFITPGDTIRLEYYKVLRPMAEASGDPDAFRQLANVLNNMTGALNPGMTGISKTQQSIERGFLFFSPRYTRASLALLGSVFRGDLEGQVARQSLAGMAGLGMATYVGFTQALGQEAHLDPSDSKFMTVQIDDDRIGIGTFWTQFAKTTSRLLETAYDDDAQEAFGGDDWLRENPLIRFVRGRSAPGAGVFWDAAVGEDYLGRPIEGPLDWTKHIGLQSTPIWFEGGVISDPYRLGATGLATEFLGARTRPLGASERRRDLRDSIAVEAYDKKYKDLNGLQRDRIKAGTAPGMTKTELESLIELDAVVMSERVEVGEEVDVATEKYFNRLDDINGTWMREIEAGMDFLNTNPDMDENIDLATFRQRFLQSSNASRRTRMEDLNNPEGEFKVALDYFNNVRDEMGVENPEDVAYFEYIAEIIATNDFDLPMGFDFEERDKRIEDFIDTWGTEIYGYVQERFQTGREIPDIVNEFWQTRKKFEYYWKDAEEQTLASMPGSDDLRIMYKEYKRSTLNEKSELKESFPRLKKFLAELSRVKSSLREQDQLLDAWLFRWGYTDTLSHPQNELSPEGFDDARTYWRMPELTYNGRWKQIFGIESGIAL